MLTGIRVSPDAFSTRNMIMALLAVSLSLFSSWSWVIALSPRGVAALSSPSRLAAIFIIMDPLAGWPLGISGNSRLKSGPTAFDIRLTIPPDSPTFISPIHRVITPVSPRDISNPVLAMSKVLFIISGKIDTSPMKIKRNSPTIKAMIKNATQM